MTSLRCFPMFVFLVCGWRPTQEGSAVDLTCCLLQVKQTPGDSAQYFGNPSRFDMRRPVAWCTPAFVSHSLPCCPGFECCVATWHGLALCMSLDRCCLDVWEPLFSQPFSDGAGKVRRRAHLVVHPVRSPAHQLFVVLWGCHTSRHVIEVSFLLSTGPGHCGEKVAPSK